MIGAASRGKAWRSAWLLSGLALGVLLSRARLASADTDLRPPARPVYLERSTCDAAAGEITSILRVELFNRVLEGTPPPEAYRTTIDCAGDLVAISVTVPAAATRSVRTSLAGVPANVRSRIVALAVAELIRDLDREPAPAPPPAPLSPAETHDRDAVAPAASKSRTESRAIDLGAFAETSSFQLSGVWLVGGGLRFDYATRRFCAGLDAAALTTTERFEPGTAQVFLAYGSPYLAWEQGWERVRARLGAGYALGAARLSGHATDPLAFAGATTGPWTAPYAFAALKLVIGAGVSLDARGQLGWVTSRVIGDVYGGSAVDLEGLWAGVQVGMAIAL